MGDNERVLSIPLTFYSDDMMKYPLDFLMEISNFITANEEKFDYIDMTVFNYFSIVHYIYNDNVIGVSKEDILRLHPIIYYISEETPHFYASYETVCLYLSSEVIVNDDDYKEFYEATKSSKVITEIITEKIINVPIKSLYDGFYNWFHEAL